MAEFDDDVSGNGWDEWRKFVLMELRRSNKSHESADRRLDIISEDIVALKVKSGVWGLVGGMIPVALLLALWLLKGL